MNAWTETFDMDSIPDEVLKAAWARRNARKRTTYTGGLFWKKHNPDAINCRCVACMRRRQEEGE